MSRTLLTAIAMVVAATAQAQEIKPYLDLETEADIRRWQCKHDNAYFKEKPPFRPEFSDEHATSGAKSLKISTDEYLSVTCSPPADWSGYQSMEIDAFVEGDATVNGSLLISDRDWEANRTYWNRHNGTFILVPGRNVISIPVDGLYRGEAGSRNNDLKHNIVPSQIVRFDIGFASKAPGAIYLDSMRLVREATPEGILAFDLGPESQATFPGFTPITWNTVHGQGGAKAGLKRACGSANRARDDTFPTRLYQDWVWFEESANEFIADVPEGPLNVWMVFADCGYWGGEQAKFTKRTILANGAAVAVEDRGPAGRHDSLHRFEAIEPRPGDDLWDLYVGELFAPATFRTEGVGGRLRLRVETDAPWSSNVAAIVIYPDAKKAEAERWVASVAERNRREFANRAVYQGAPAPAQEAADAQELAIGYPTMDRNLSLLDDVGDPSGSMRRTGARGQRLAFTFAVRPGADLGAVGVVASDLTAGAATIPASAVEIAYVHHLTRRSGGGIGYVIAPSNVRPLAGSGLGLPKGLTRQFWITVAVPEDAAPGTYAGGVTLTAGAISRTLPLSVEVLDLALDEPDFNVGFFDVWAPTGTPEERAASMRSALLLMKRNGMNTMTGGPNIPFTGLDESGRPKLDFSACDQFFAVLKECGYTRPIYTYGGPAMVTGLHGSHRIGKEGRAWAEKTGKPFNELLALVWTAVKEHGESQGWPPLNYGMLDEPRVLDDARQSLELHRAYRDAVPFLRTGGYYSIHWDDDPVNLAIQDIFATMHWSGLNVHTQVDLDKARELGREIHIYNQGYDRFSFGAYQFAEMRKGVKGRIQWHANALHGYQFFDLDGREPDTAAMMWGRAGAIPTMVLVRANEGMGDFRFATTLMNLAEARKDSPASEAALAFLDGISRQIPIGERLAPKEYIGDEAFRLECIRHIKAILAR
ncbi:MAG TPA: hypothetical protein VEL07_02375 [Planctomycetota bacterium]|nr:hypothetical protein [Planctomycetota bacterium]